MHAHFYFANITNTNTNNTFFKYRYIQNYDNILFLFINSIYYSFLTLKEQIVDMEL